MIQRIESNRLLVRSARTAQEICDFAAMVDSLPSNHTGIETEEVVEVVEHLGTTHELHIDVVAFIVYLLVSSHPHRQRVRSPEIDTPYHAIAVVDHG